MERLAHFTLLFTVIFPLNAQNPSSHYVFVAQELCDSLVLLPPVAPVEFRVAGLTEEITNIQLAEATEATFRDLEGLTVGEAMQDIGHQRPLLVATVAETCPEVVGPRLFDQSVLNFEALLLVERPEWKKVIDYAIATGVDSLLSQQTYGISQALMMWLKESPVGTDIDTLAGMEYAGQMLEVLILHALSESFPKLYARHTMEAYDGALLNSWLETTDWQQLIARVDQQDQLDKRCQQIAKMSDEEFDALDGSVLLPDFSSLEDFRAYYPNQVTYPSTLNMGLGIMYIRQLLGNCSALKEKTRQKMLKVAIEELAPTSPEEEAEFVLLADKLCDCMQSPSPKPCFLEEMKNLGLSEDISPLTATPEQARLMEAVGTIIPMIMGGCQPTME